MAVMVIGGVTLDNNMGKPDKNKYPDLIASSYESIAGNEVVVQQARGVHYPITLKAERGYGWQFGSTVTSLRALSAVLGATYPFTDSDGSTKTVRFRNEQSGGAVQMQPLVEGAEGDAHYWIGTIYLMCVG